MPTDKMTPSSIARKLYGAVFGRPSGTSEGMEAWASYEATDQRFGLANLAYLGVQELGAIRRVGERLVKLGERIANALESGPVPDEAPGPAQRPALRVADPSEVGPVELTSDEESDDADTIDAETEEEEDP